MGRWIKLGFGLVFLTFGCYLFVDLLRLWFDDLADHQFQVGAGGLFGEAGSEAAAVVASFALTTAGFLMLRANWKRKNG